MGAPVVGTVLTMCRGFVYYARLLLVPVDMAIDFHAVPAGGLDPVTIVCAVIQVGVLAAAGIYAIRRRRAFPFAVFWFFATLFPASNLLIPSGISTAERFLYIPMVGVALPAGILLARVFRKSGLGRLSVALLLGCLAAVSIDRALVWVTDDRLWEATLSRGEAPDGLDRRIRTLGEEMRAAGNSEQVRRLLDESLEMHDRRIHYWAKLPAPQEQMLVMRANRLYLLIGLGRFDTARFEEVLREADAIHGVRPDLPDARAVAAHALFWMDRRFEARQVMTEVLAESKVPRIRASAGEFYSQLGMAYHRDGNKALARRFFRRSLDLGGGPDRMPDAGRSLAELDEEFSTTLGPLESRRSRNPHDPTILLRLAELNARYGRFQEAMRIYGGLLRGLTSPREPALLYSLARWYWESQDTPSGYRAALALYREIRRDSPEWEPMRVRERLRACETR
jgi:tetratricopeptide (TPR) repeat protein